MFTGIWPKELIWFVVSLYLSLYILRLSMPREIPSDDRNTNNESDMLESSREIGDAFILPFFSITTTHCAIFAMRPEDFPNGQFEDQFRVPVPLECNGSRTPRFFSSSSSSTYCCCTTAITTITITSSSTFILSLRDIDSDGSQPIEFIIFFFLT